ncbi:UNVERIFIED_CONTAM: hypothetical protein Sradi_5378000 [Sesamum radiatum]|uniref:Uncharacterized protein n=1 Tax=Sesamum radiatum TaxID=300843 RepID=A0AAW2LPW8_SESRA
MCTSKKSGGMGFRNLRAFNLALLAKQGWRVLKNPNLLLSRIWKAKYFVRSDFLQAKRGYNSSFTWRSILEARPTLIAGLRWRVGDGQRVKVWEDPWIPRPVMFKPITPRNQIHPDLRVAELIESTDRSWNKELVEDLFWLEDATTILSILLGRSPLNDEQVWHYTKSGIFSVKSAYHVACRLFRDRCSSFAGSSGSGAKEWSFLWGTMVPNKVKVFLWRLSCDALPTAENLTRRKCSNDMSCSTCGGGYRWEMGAAEWIQRVREKVDHGQFNLFGMVCWMIWFRRNKYAMEKMNMDPLAVVCSAKSLLNDFNNSVVKNERERPAKDTKWKPPDHGCIKINFDAATFKDRTGIGVGVVARDDSGVCLAWQMDFVAGLREAEFGEAIAARMAVELGRRFGWEKCIIEGDCLRVIKKLTTRQHDLSPVEPIIVDIFRNAIGTTHFSFVHVNRIANHAAHTVARHATIREEGIFPPVFLLPAILADNPI